MNFKSQAEALSEEQLSEFRRMAESFLHAWPEGLPFNRLAPELQTELRSLANELLHLGDRSRPTGRALSSSRNREDDVAKVDQHMEGRVGVGLDELSDLFALDSVKGFGPQKFRALHEGGITPREVLSNPDALPISGKTGSMLRDALREVSQEDWSLARDRAARQIVVADENQGSILTYNHLAYPPIVMRSNNAVPVMYARGNLSILRNPWAVACVGSREIREPYSSLQARFAEFVARKGAVVVSGFALGADTIAHTAAVDDGGSTICVMPCGLDRPFPPENKLLFQEYVERSNVVFISEFPFGTGANSMNLRKRNKLIVGAALGVMVGQSSFKGGAMNAFRFGIEQDKPVATFATDHTPATSGNEEISKTTRGRTQTFSAEPNPYEWDQWLSRL